MPREGRHGLIYPSDEGSTWLKVDAGVQVLARAGVASRRAAEEIIAGGQVRVNGEVVLVPQHQVAETFDKVRSLQPGPICKELKPRPPVIQNLWGCSTLVPSTRSRSHLTRCAACNPA